jgi:hypothetical protein
LHGILAADRRPRPNARRAAVKQICAAASSEIVQCSMSMKNESKPHASAIMAISLVRASLVAIHSAISPRARRSRTRLLTGMIRG